MAKPSEKVRIAGYVCLCLAALAIVAGVTLVAYQEGVRAALAKFSLFDTWNLGMLLIAMLPGAALLTLANRMDGKQD